MRWPLLVASLAFLGCEQSAAATLQEQQARQPQLEDVHTTVMGPYREWVASPPYDCTSPKLRTSINGARAFAREMQDIQVRNRGVSLLRELYASGDWQVEIADGARQHGCTEFARQVYNDVLSIYIGPGYATLRQRAQIGIEEARNEPQPTQGTSQPTKASSKKPR
jgi:hypothetical protein